MRKFVLRLMCAVTGIGLLDPTLALADPLLVTSGHVTAQMSGGTFTLSGEGFSLTGAPPFGYESGLWECSPCRASDRLNLSLSSSADGTFDDLPGVFDSVQYDRTYLAGHLAFTAGDMTSAILQAGQTSISMPFTFFGELANYETYESRATNGSRPLFIATFTGSGIATAYFRGPFADPNGVLFFADRITYDFTPAATPEPASLLLLGTGVAGLFGRRRGRRGVPRIAHVRAACLALAFLLSGNVAFADPVRVITFGAFGSGGDDTGFFAVGENFSVGTGALPPGAGPVVTCSPCTPGSSLNLSAAVTIANWGAGNATIDGQTWHGVYYSGSLLFDAGSVIVPDVQPQPPGLDGTVIVPAFTTFTFTGTLNGFADPNLTGTPLFSIQLTGGGSGPLGAQAGFGNLGSGTFLDYADYSFNDVAATPEPGSLLLFGSGAAWIAARWRRRASGWRERQEGAR